MYGDSWVLRGFGSRWTMLAAPGLVGLVLLARVRAPLLVLVGWQTAGVLAFFVTSRYRLALVPFLALAAGRALVETWNAVRARRSRRLGGLGAGFLAAALVVGPDWTGSTGREFGRPDFDAAEVLARRGDRMGALQAYERAILRHPDDPDVHFRYGEQLARFGRADSALAAYDRAAALAPWSYKPPLAAGALRLERGELEAAWAAFAAAERRGDPHGRTLYDMALVRELQARYAEALDLYRKSLERQDDRRERVERRLGVARMLARLGRPEEAEVEFRAAASEAPDPARVARARAAALAGVTGAGAAPPDTSARP